MNASQIAGPETASDTPFSNSDDRQSHVSISPIEELQSILKDLHTRLSNPPDLTFSKEHAFIYNTARERANSIQSIRICDLGEIVLCHAIVSLSARLLWRVNRVDSDRASAIWHAKQAIKIAKRMIDRVESGKPVKFCREDALRYNVLGLSIIRLAFPCVSPNDVQDLVAYCYKLCAKLCHEATIARSDEISIICCEMAEIYRSGGYANESNATAIASIRSAERYIKSQNRKGKPEEARKWKVIQQQIADRFGIHLKS